MRRASIFISIPLFCWTNQDGGRETRAKSWPTAHMGQSRAFLLTFFFFFHSLPLLVCEDGQLVFVPDTCVSLFFNLGHGPGVRDLKHTHMSWLCAIGQSGQHTLVTVVSSVFFTLSILLLFLLNLEPTARHFVGCWLRLDFRRPSWFPAPVVTSSSLPSIAGGWCHWRARTGSPMMILCVFKRWYICVWAHFSVLSKIHLWIVYLLSFWRNGSSFLLWDKRQDIMSGQNPQQLK